MALFSQPILPIFTAFEFTFCHLPAPINTNLVVQNTPFVFDYQNGVYGYNTDTERGADTFHPFRSTPYWIVNGDSGNIDSITLDGLIVGEKYMFSSYGVLNHINSGNFTNLYTLVGGSINNQFGSVINGNYTAVMLFTATNTSVTISSPYDKNGSFNKFRGYCVQK